MRWSLRKSCIGFLLGHSDGQGSGVVNLGVLVGDLKAFMLTKFGPRPTIGILEEELWTDGPGGGERDR
jgi:hypothetical protein